MSEPGLGRYMGGAYAIGGISIEGMSSKGSGKMKSILPASFERFFSSFQGLNQSAGLESVGNITNLLPKLGPTIADKPIPTLFKTQQQGASR